MIVGHITFPEFTGLRCLMLPYIQGDPESLPDGYDAYHEIIESVSIERGSIGFLTIDESIAVRGKPHRGKRAKHGRALHTEVGRCPVGYQWGNGGGSWGGSPRVIVDADTKILLANNLDRSCAVWNATHADTSDDGDIGDCSEMYPYDDAIMMNAGEVHCIGILTPHESIPVPQDFRRQFFRIVGTGVHGSEPYFTENPKVAHPPHIQGIHP